MNWDRIYCIMRKLVKRNSIECARTIIHLWIVCSQHLQPKCSQLDCGSNSYNSNHGMSVLSFRLFEFECGGNASPSILSVSFKIAAHYFSLVGLSAGWDVIIYVEYYIWRITHKDNTVFCCNILNHTDINTFLK